LRFENEADLLIEDDEGVSGGGDSVRVCLASGVGRKGDRTTCSYNHVVFVSKGAKSELLSGEGKAVIIRCGGEEFELFEEDGKLGRKIK
jgi:hypothetical protein